VPKILPATPHPAMRQSHQKEPSPRQRRGQSVFGPHGHSAALDLKCNREPTVCPAEAQPSGFQVLLPGKKGLPRHGPWHRQRCCAHQRARDLPVAHRLSPATRSVAHRDRARDALEEALGSPQRANQHPEQSRTPGALPQWRVRCQPGALSRHNRRQWVWSGLEAVLVVYCPRQFPGPDDLPVVGAS
jgi:hypothetical protein